MAQYLGGGTPGYVTPSAGVITSYSVRASATPGLVRLVVFGPSATAGHRTVAALSAQNAVVVNTVNTFPTRVPVATGLSIGLNNSAGGMLCGGGGRGAGPDTRLPRLPARDREWHVRLPLGRRRRTLPDALVSRGLPSLLLSHPSH